MSLKNNYEKVGEELFRYRSYFPLVMFPIIIYDIIFNNININYSSTLILGIITSYIGEIIRILTIAFIFEGTSGRNTKTQFATKLNTTGIYSIVRHPLYLGNYFILLGPCIFTGNINIIIIYTLSFWLYYERIMFAEEKYLENKFNHEFNNWTTKVPAFIPNIKLYLKPKGTFSFKRVIEHEYTGILGIIIMYSILLMSQNYKFDNYIHLSKLWNMLLVLTVLMFIIIRTYKKIIRLK